MVVSKLFFSLDNNTAAILLVIYSLRMFSLLSLGGKEKSIRKKLAIKAIDKIN